MDGHSPQPEFTVFTPTHNRAHTLHRVFDSLQNQTFDGFEWLVIDDGSTDGTDDLVRGWQRRAGFPIRYLHQVNAGKHAAFNRGVWEARGRFFLTLDSDDSCVPEALARLHFHWNDIPIDIRPGFSAVTCLCRNQFGRIVGGRFPNDPTDSDPLEIRLRFRVRGEKWGFHLTSVLREFPFPTMPGQPYVTEDFVWNRIAARYRTRYVNEVLRTYYVESHENSLTKQAGAAHQRAPMYALSTQRALNEDLRWFRTAPSFFLKQAANYTRYSLHCGRTPIEQARALRPAVRGLHLAMSPLGGLLYLRDERRRDTVSQTTSAGGAGRRHPGEGGEPA